MEAVLRKSAVVALMLQALLIGTQIGFAFRAEAEPYPGCPFKTYTAYSVCSDTPGVPGFTPGFTLVEGVPGTIGPQGLYTPIQAGR